MAGSTMTATGVVSVELVWLPVTLTAADGVPVVRSMTTAETVESRPFEM